LIQVNQLNSKYSLQGFLKAATLQRQPDRPGWSQNRLPKWQHRNDHPNGRLTV